MGREARERARLEAAAREARERSLREIAALAAAIEAAPGRPLATRRAATRLRRLLTTLRDDVPPELLERAREALARVSSR